MTRKSLTVNDVTISVNDLPDGAGSSVSVFVGSSANGFTRVFDLAQIECIALSSDGALCCFETGICLDDIPNDQMLFVCESCSGVEIGKFSVAEIFGHGVCPEILSLESTYVVFRGDPAAVRVSFAGEVLNADEKLGNDLCLALRSDYGYSLCYLSEQFSASGAVALLEESLKRDFEGAFRADVLRRLGERFEELGHIEKAIELYAKALEINPSVGIKRHFNALVKSREVD